MTGLLTFSRQLLLFIQLTAEGCSVGTRFDV